MALLILFFFLFFIKISHTVQLCSDSCSPIGPEVRFPFSLAGDGCRSHPGFNLSCSVTGQTILNLPHSGNFIVQFVDYQTQEITIRDPENCFARRLLDNFTLSGSPFVTQIYGTFSFLNCSSNFSSSESLPPFSRMIHCLSDENFTVVAIPTSFYRYIPSMQSCTVKSEMVHVPVYWPRSTEGYSSLKWTDPYCAECEQSGGNCGFKDSSTLDIGCSNLPSKTHGLPRSAKYGIIIGVGIPGLLCIIGVGCYLCGRLRNYNSRSHHSTAEVTITFPHPSSISINGLDVPTIESYPKTLLGESRRLPKPHDNTCPICLCEYQAKETLRTIPECNHYFHAPCIDEWLKMNATCPLCRNSPELSSGVTTPSSLLSTSSSSLSSVRQM